MADSLEERVGRRVADLLNRGMSERELREAVAAVLRDELKALRLPESLIDGFIRFYAGGASLSEIAAKLPGRRL